MTIRFNGWQRLWIVVSALMLVLPLSLVGILWPERESGILADLNAPACKPWRELPDGFFPDKYPEWGEECHSLGYFLYYRQINVRSERDYDSYLIRSRAKLVLIALLLWAGIVVVIYVLGWSVGWIARGFSKTPPA
jgi:hypothetical protein